MSDTLPRGVPMIPTAGSENIEDLINDLIALQLAQVDKLLDIVDESARAVLDPVLKDLFPLQKRATALSLLRQFRQAIDEDAKEAGVRFSLETDGQTRAEPEHRIIWFECEDQVAQTVMVEMDT